jgi:hypothetical protein
VIPERKLRLSLLAAVVVAMLFEAGSLRAASASGSMAVAVTVEGSIAIMLDGAGESYAGVGSSVTLPVRVAPEAFASGFVRRRIADGWQLSAPLTLRVEQANLSSSTYSVAAVLSTPAPEGTVWRLNGASLNETATMVTGNASYGADERYLLDVLLTGAGAKRPIEEDILFLVLTN